jgi:transcriptional regulator with XRE-family HTH domain
MKTDEQNTAPPRLSTARSRELGEELRRIRGRARMSSGLVAEALGWSLGKLSKLETGTRGTSAVEIGTLVGRLGADKPTRDRVLAIAGEPDTGSFLRQHDRIPDTLVALSLHEQTARTITTYEPLTIPSLAQTEDYAHALTGNRNVARARIARQQAVHRQSCSKTVLYIHEAALRMAVGEPAVMRDQLLHLTLMCGSEQFVPRVIPMAARSHAALRNPATILTFDPPIKPLAYTETDSATVFHDAPAAVLLYQTKMRHLDSLAVTPTESHDILGHWADTYERQANR